MRQELKDKLATTFPTFFVNHRGLPECFDGWFMLLWDLCNEIQALNPPADFRVAQIKEKFGTLRFYADNATDEIYKAIRKAERKSAKVCERCGRAGSSQGDGWIKTLCDDCEELRKSGKRMWR